jgi:hypothetical protein
VASVYPSELAGEKPIPRPRRHPFARLSMKAYGQDELLEESYLHQSVLMDDHHPDG